LVDSQYDGMSEDEIYDLLQKNGSSQPNQNSVCFGNGGDLVADLTKEQLSKVVNNVIKAEQQHKLANGKNPGNLPGNASEILKQFLKPVVKWDDLLHQFMTELAESRRDWGRPNRRYQHIYLPSRVKDEGKLAHLAYFCDTSGSITVLNTDNVRLAHVDLSWTIPTRFTGMVKRSIAEANVNFPKTRFVSPVSGSRILTIGIKPNKR